MEIARSTSWCMPMLTRTCQSNGETVTLRRLKMEKKCSYEVSARAITEWIPWSATGWLIEWRFGLEGRVFCVMEEAAHIRLAVGIRRSARQAGCFNTKTTAAVRNYILMKDSFFYATCAWSSPNSIAIGVSIITWRRSSTKGA